MLIALVIVSILFILQTLYICFYKKQIQDISNQLTFITAHHSFKFIQTQIKPNEIAELIKQCNQLLEEQRVLNQEFKKKSEEINITIASLSHDIRTPLTSLDGYLQLALRTDSEKEKAKYVSRAQTKIKQIITLVDELFLYSKVQNSRYQLELELVNASDLLQKRFFSFLDELTEKKYEPNFNLPNSPVYLIGNETALERVFDNIIRNYLLHGVGALTVRFEENENEFKLFFSNPLNESHLLEFDNLFTPFYKADSSRSNLSSGLGLSIVQSLVEKMAGSAKLM